MRILLLYRNRDDREALMDLLASAHISSAPQELDYGWTLSVDEHATRGPRLLAILRKLREIVVLFCRVWALQPDVIAFCTHHPAFRLFKILKGERARVVCYLRTQHCLESAQSLSDRISERARRAGVNTALIDNYLADFSLAPGMINKRFLLRRGIASQRCASVGFYPRPKQNARRARPQVIIATQNWAGHGFDYVGVAQTKFIHALAERLRAHSEIDFLVRPHPRDRDPYLNLVCDRSPDFVTRISPGDIVLSNLSSFAVDTWVRGATVLFYSFPEAASMYSELYTTFSIEPIDDINAIVEQVTYMISGGAVAASERFFREAVHREPNSEAVIAWLFAGEASSC